MVWFERVPEYVSPCGAPGTGSCFIHHQNTKGCDGVVDGGDLGLSLGAWR
ncbi:MAG TPA: hypothetical protein PKC43_13100 [Phycisphaerales bacterium]|nr:hypothetical protein [Phycisphaerales bacterium]HMP38369.1 hypothetical protein [Phycisphaerales bacterium]